MTLLVGYQQEQKSSGGEKVWVILSCNNYISDPQMKHQVVDYVQKEETRG